MIFRARIQSTVAYLQRRSRWSIGLQANAIVTASQERCCTRGIAPLSELKRGRGGTDSDLVHLLPGGTAAQRFFSNRAVPPMADDSSARQLSQLPRSP